MAARGTPPSPPAGQGIGPAPDHMPHDPRAEAAVLGSLLIDGDAAPVVFESVGLRPAHFRVEAHRLVFAAALELYRHNTPIDLITLPDALMVAGHLDDVGGASHVSALANIVPTSANVAYYARIVKRLAITRESMQLGADMTAAAYRTTDAEALAAQVLRWRERLDALAQDAAPTASTDAVGRFHLLGVREMLDRPRPDPLIDRHISLNSTGILYGPSGVGKSVLLLDMMAHVALGRAWQGHAVTQGPVVYVCAEGDAFMGERLRAWMLTHGVEDIPGMHILPVAPQLLEPTTVPDLLATFTQELPAPPVWTVFDTVSQTSIGANENDPSEMARYVHALGVIREATRGHVMAVHHTGKDESKGFRGASSLMGNIDTMIEIAAFAETAIMRCGKQKGGWAPFAPRSFKVRTVALDEFADRTGPVFEAVEHASGADGSAAGSGSSRGKPMPDNYRKMLDVLAARGADGMQHGEWERESGIGHGSFDRGLKHLLAMEFVIHDKDAGLYLTTIKAAKSVPRYYRGTTTDQAGFRLVPPSTTL